MEIREISKNIFLFRFDKALENFIGINIIMIQNGNEALLIDTGYENNFLELQDHLDKNNIRVTDVVVSHFHPDHIGGLKYLKDANIYGSELGEISLRKYNVDIDHLIPNIKVLEELSINFGGHNIKLVKNPGHSIDGMLISIDNKYLYVADDMVFSHKGLALVPFCADRNVQNHISSIEKISNCYIGKIIIPSHGEIIENQELIKLDLENRLTYLKYIQKYPNCSFQEFVEETGIKLIGIKNHVYNTKKEVK